MKIILVRSRSLNSNPDKIAEFLIEKGYKVSLLLWDRQDNYSNEKLNRFVNRFRLKAPYDEIKIVFYHPFWLFYQFIFLLKDDSDIVHAADLDTLFPAFLIKFIKGKTLYYTIYDFYADNLPHYFPKFFVSFVASTERFLINYVDHLFLVDESRYEQVKSCNIKKLSYIYNSPVDCYDEKLQTTKKNYTVLFYAGVLHESRGLKNVIELITAMDNIKLIFAGDGPLKSQIKHLDSSNDKFMYLGVISYDEVLKRTSESDIIFAFYDPAIGNNKYASPNKLFEAMMLAKPIIVNDNSSMSDIVKKYNCGIVVPYGDIEAIKKAIIQLIDNPQMGYKLGQNGRIAYEKYYSWDIMQQRILNAYGGN